MVADFEVTEQPFRAAPDGRIPAGLLGKPSLHLPLVAFVSACPEGGNERIFFHNSKGMIYGK
ncbi:hypothetical protein [Dysgonomonas sp. 511]|uniref:hypothetical protein n=1 Tax=Dysgonomonas sp. 511 TaxID=2302930 RepID=UPI0013D42532|nr:hypothetical protein [Dysgonomonas sp. 511]